MLPSRSALRLLRNRKFSCHTQLQTGTTLATSFDHLLYSSEVGVAIQPPLSSSVSDIYHPVPCRESQVAATCGTPGLFLTIAPMEWLLHRRVDEEEREPRPAA